jgi:hypothetical protein
MIKSSRGVLFAVRIENGKELMAATVNNKPAPKNQ